MAQNKVFSFPYKVKEKDPETGEEKVVEKEGEAEALQYTDVADIIAFYEEQEAGEGEIRLVAAFNKMQKDVAIANERARLTRVPKVPKSILEKAEGLDAEDMQKFQEVMAKLGLKL